MAKYFSFGQFNKRYFFILGSITVRIIISFITGLTPSLTPNNTLFIFGFRPNFFSHPILSYCFQYLSLCLGGLLLEYVLKKKNQNEESGVKAISDNETNVIRKRTNTKYIFNDRRKRNEKKNYPEIFLVYSLYYFAKIGMNSLDNLGYNRVKYWTLEFIFLYIFSKKILNKIMYRHQILSLSTIFVVCSTIYVINSFIPQTNKDCSILTGTEFEECEMLSLNIYNDITKKLGAHFIPIFILIYIGAMVSNAYSSIKTKWFMDIKYININRMLIYIGIIGLFYSFILLIIFSSVSCSTEDSAISYICRFEYQGEFYYDNLITLGNIESNYELFIDIFVLIPIYLVCSFLVIFFELLIIRDLDPFYLIPIDSIFFLILDIIDYSITYSITNVNKDTKFALQVCSNSMDIFLCSIYLEIIELHCCSLDLHLKRFIIKRVQREETVLLDEINQIYELENDDRNSVDTFGTNSTD